MFLQHSPGAIRRTIIHHHHFHIGVTLFKTRFHRINDEVFFIVSRNEHRDEGKFREEVTWPLRGRTNRKSPILFAQRMQSIAEICGDVRIMRKAPSGLKMIPRCRMIFARIFRIA